MMVRHAALALACLALAHAIAAPAAFCPKVLEPLDDGSFAFRDGQCRVKRYRLFKKSLRKRNLWPKMSSQEVAAYVAMAVAAAGAIVRVLRGRRGKIYDKYP